MSKDLAPLIGPDAMKPQDSISHKLAHLRKQAQRINLDRRWAEILEKIYMRTGNGLAAWDAYREAREREEIIPPWVMGYLDHVAANLCRKGNMIQGLAEYLEMKGTRGARSAFTRYENYWDHRRAVMDVLQEIYETPHQSVESACEKVLGRNKGLMIDSLRLKEIYNELHLEW